MVSFSNFVISLFVSNLDIGPFIVVVVVVVVVPEIVHG
jgi:hypothetical protein